MTRHPILLGAAFAAIMAVPLGALPAKTAPEKQPVWGVPDVPTIQSARVQSLVGASVHAIHAGF